MTVQSKPMTQRRTLNTGDISVGLALLVFGALLWIAGARYTLLGWVYGINWFAQWLGLPALVPSIVGWGVLLAFPVGLLYSFVELRRPWRYHHNDWTKVLLVWIIWFIIVLTDGGSTYLGVRQPAPDAWLLTQQVAASPTLSGGWSLILTFVPEWFMLGGLALLRR